MSDICKHYELEETNLVSGDKKSTVLICKHCGAVYLDPIARKIKYEALLITGLLFSPVIVGTIWVQWFTPYGLYLDLFLAGIFSRNVISYVLVRVKK